MNKRYAIISDIHGNAWALKAVLNDISRREVTDCINLGDIFYGPLKPQETYFLLRDENFHTVMGNQDRQLLNATPEEIDNNPTLQYVLEDLGSEPLDWLRDIPPARVLDNDLFLCHGTPDNDIAYLLEDVSTGYPRIKENQDITALLAGCEQSIIMCGHSHLPRTVQLSFGQIIVNPGSVGLPAFSDNQPVKHSMQTFSSYADYMILEKTDNDWEIMHIKTPYAHREAAQKAGALGREDWGYALLTGRSRI